MKNIEIGNSNYEIGKWSYGFYLRRDYARAQGYRVMIFCYKLIKKAPVGEVIRRKIHYRGFDWTFGFYFTIYS